MTVGEGRAAVVAATLVLLLGLLVVIRPAEGEIAERTSTLSALEETLATRTAVLRQATTLRQTRDTLRRRLAVTQLEGDPGRVTVRLLRQTAAVAARTRVAVTALADEPAGAPNTHLRLSLRGPYVASLAAIRALAASDVAVDLGLISMTVDGTSTPGTSPQLLTVLAVSLIRPQGEAFDAQRTR